MFGRVQYSLEDEVPTENNAVRIGVKKLEDAVVNIGSFKKAHRQYGDKNFILNTIKRKDINTLREISNYYYESSGIYQRICKYLAFLYRYDWHVTPFAKDKANDSKLLKDYTKVLFYFDDSNVKKVLGDIALAVVKDGVYYGYLVDEGSSFQVQQLPARYCRSRFKKNGQDIVEVNLQFFDSCFSNVQYRLKVLSLFPKELQKAYIKFKEGKLKQDVGDDYGWFMLDPGTGVKFNLNDSDFPPLIQAIPSIIDLDEAQELDRKKTMQQLLKIVIQKLPIDKNGDLVFDLDEARDLHNNAVTMLKRAVGVDVLTTFADTEVADMQDDNSTATSDDLQRVERTVYNNLGVSQNLFNTEGNTALEKSILNDEATMRDLVYQFEMLLNTIIKRFDKTQYNFRIEILETTIYNYKDIAKMYKEQTQIGYSKMLPQIALGHSQSSIIATAHFENEILHLSEIMLPPMSSNTMNSNVLQQQQQAAHSSSTSKNNSSENEVGRPEKADDEKSDKTLQNREAMS